MVVEYFEFSSTVPAKKNFANEERQCVTIHEEGPKNEENANQQTPLNM
jgi:hypothetical protein